MTHLLLMHHSQCTAVTPSSPDAHLTSTPNNPKTELNEIFETKKVGVIFKMLLRIHIFSLFSCYEIYKLPLFWKASYGFPQFPIIPKFQTFITGISQVMVKLMKMITVLKISSVSSFCLSKYQMKNCLIFIPPLMYLEWKGKIK